MLLLRDMASRTSILVVEDDRAMREMLVSLLEEEGIAARGVEDGEQALRALRRQEFDAVLSDCDMPHMGGLALLEQLRSFRPRLPVVLMTALGGSITADEARDAGAVDFLQKPFAVDELLRKLARAVPH
jgi:DNA-binding NtrC family response regulator